MSRRTMIEKYFAKAGYDANIPMAYLNVFEDDDDAHIASLQNLLSGRTGAWYDSVTEFNPEGFVPEPDPLALLAQIDAQADMEADRASKPRD